LSADSVNYIHLNAIDKSYNHYRIIASYNSGDVFYSQPVRIFLPEYVPKVRSYYKGQPFIIPGTIEAEFFDVGGEGLTYHDDTDNNITGALRPGEAVDIYHSNDENYMVGSIWPGEWLEYTVNVENSDLYQVDYVIAAYQSGGTFTTQIGQNTSKELIAPSTNSMIITKDVTDTMQLQTGEHIMRINFTAIPAFNLDKIIFTAISIPTVITDYETNILSIKRLSDKYFRVSWKPDIEIKNLSLYTVYGVLIKSVNEPYDHMDIILDNYPDGIYIVKAQNADKTFSVKFLAN
jgi:hypothetical protein